MLEAPIMRWALIIALTLGTGLALPGTASAESEDSVLPAEGKRARILRRIKRAEQEGFERHNLKHYFSIFSKKATWQFARRSEPDPHEYNHSYNEHRKVKALRWKRKPGSKQIHFRWVKWKVVDTQPVIETEVAVAMNVNEGTITSSPGPIPSSRNAAINAPEPLLQGEAYATPQ